jgi:inhibitor of KinA sporulation pathway (predicted exonuclease)
MHIMIDLETMGTRPNSPIVALGAVAFDGEGVQSSFYEAIDLARAVRDGAVMDPETVIWWLGQSDEARQAITRRGVEPRAALNRFSAWMGQFDIDGVWGNGASFDNVILSETYARLDMKAPWKFWTDRCYRTVKNMYPSVELARSGTHHNALDDARSQAEHLLEINDHHGPFL